MIYRWVLISVIMQAAVLSYINFIYLPGRGAVKATMYQGEMEAIKNRSIKLPDGASEVKVSFDGLYAAYRLENEVLVADIDRKKTIKKLTPSGGVFTYFRWLQDREMLIYSIKEPDGMSGKVRISTYDIVPELERSYPDIKGLPKGSEVIDLELSPLTNIVYPMVKISETKAKIYKFDIMDNLKLIMTTGISTIIKETMYTDSLAYQPADGKIRMRSGKTGKITQMPVKEAKLLLATDDNDDIYLAATDENKKITALYSGKIGQKANEWKTVKLSQPLSAADIFITAEGTIYSADKQRRTIQLIESADADATNLCIESADAIAYKGELLTVLDNYVVSLDGNKLILRIIKW